MGERDRKGEPTDTFRSQEGMKNAVKAVPFILLFVGLIAAYIIFGFPHKPLNPIDDKYRLSDTATPSPTPIQITELEAQRQGYGLPAETFSELPKPPVDFYARKEQFEHKGLPLNILDTRYWLQPEWNPTFPGGVALMKNYPSDRRARCCYGFYPAEYIGEIPANQTGTVIAYFLVQSSWGVATYQSFVLDYYFPASADLALSSFRDGTRIVEQNPDEVKRGIKSITITPNEIIIEPSYAIWKLTDNATENFFNLQVPRFSKKWTVLVKMQIEVGNLAAGKYAIAVRTNPPTRAMYDAGLWSYSNLYEAGGSFNGGRPWETIFLDVK